MPNLRIITSGNPPVALVVHLLALLRGDNGHGGRLQAVSVDAELWGRENRSEAAVAWGAIFIY